MILQSMWHVIIRIFAFISKDIRIILHQPRLIFSLILGPFLILLLFGIGYRQQPRTLETLFVVPESSKIEDLVKEYAESFGERISNAGIIRDAEEADRRLREREVDLVVVAPLDPLTNWENDEQSILSLYHYEIDPVEEAYIQVLGQRYAEEINEEIMLAAIDQSRSEAGSWQQEIDQAQEKTASLKRAIAAGNQLQAENSTEELNQWLDVFAIGVGSGAALIGNLENAGNQPNGNTQLDAELDIIQGEIESLVELIEGEHSFGEAEATISNIDNSLTNMDELLSRFQKMDPGVIVSPFRSETMSVTQVRIEAMHFYVPAVISLLLQHLAITLAGLSIIREKLGGSLELIRAAPGTAIEMLFGKYGGYFLVIGLLAAILTGLVLWGLRVPLLGSWVHYILVVAALLLASLGIGFNISLLARSDSQAIQYGMLTLLAAIFFSGFFLPLYRLAPAVRIISWLLPATYGTTMLQDVMLRGQHPSYLLLIVLIAFAVLLFIMAWIRLGRQMQIVTE
jgi:ABC-2 type transport system permease protein